MAPPRYQEVGRTYHVNAKCVDGAKLFRDDTDRLTFLRMLRRETRRSEWTVLAYTLMSNHVHIILRLNKLTLSSGFQSFNSLYAREYNRCHGRRGALWQRRFWDTVVETDRHLVETIRYVALNAPRANMCEAPEDWPWSSYGAAIAICDPDPIVDEGALLELFGTRPEEARANLKALVDERDPRRAGGRRRV